MTASSPIVLALIPARGGSKRIPGKNIRLLGSLPLIAHTIRCARAAGCFSRILVSTDDPTIAEVARVHGGNVPWLRSALNATDASTTIDTILEVIDHMEANGAPMPDALMLLQPTSPFRSVENIHRAVALYRETNGESVVSVSPATSHPWWCKRIADNGELLPFLSGIDDGLRSQDLPPAYTLNGSIYLCGITNLRARRSLYSAHTRALVIDSPEEALDIDTPFDWLIAEAICRSREETSP